MAAPLIPSAAPTNAAKATRGRRIVWTIVTETGSPWPASAAHSDHGESRTGPSTTPSTAAAARLANAIVQNRVRTRSVYHVGVEQPRELHPNGGHADECGVRHQDPVCAVRQPPAPPGIGPERLSSGGGREHDCRPAP